MQIRRVQAWRQKQVLGLAVSTLMLMALNRAAGNTGRPAAKGAAHHPHSCLPHPEGFLPPPSDTPGLSLPHLPVHMPLFLPSFLPPPNDNYQPALSPFPPFPLTAAHGCLQLEHGGAGPIPRVDRLLVLDQRQRQQARAGVQRGLGGVWVCVG